MNETGPHLPNFGDHYLQTGCSVIHFYYSAAEQMRFLPFVEEGLRLGQTVVLAAESTKLQVFASTRKLLSPRRAKAGLEQVELTANLPACLPVLAQAVREAALASRVVRLLADFDSLVAHDNVFEVEALLSSSLKGLKLMIVTQYDGNAVSAPITVEQFKTHSLAIVGNAFYYENRHHIAPEAYYRKRAAAAAGR